MSAVVDLQLEDLPALLREVAELIGLPAALRLVEHYGGTLLYVRQNPTADYELVEVIGMKAARRLADHFGLEQLEVPRCAEALRALRDREICRLYLEEDWTAGRLARKYGLTMRQVWRILAAARNIDTTQANLFN
jgi:Mor family transcriptional regulator